MEEIKLMALFGDITGAEVKDCIVDQDGERLIFVVGLGHLGLAIGRRGVTIKRARTILKRHIDVVEDAESPEGFVRNALAPARVSNVNVQEQSKGRRASRHRRHHNQRRIRRKHLVLIETKPVDGKSFK